MISKRTVLLGSGFLSIVLVILDRVGTDTVCGWMGQDTVCMGILYSTMTNSFPLFALFILSLITYKMRDEVYRAWLRFAYVWVPFSIVLIFLSPQYSTDWMYPVEKGTVAFLTSALFAIISLILIVWKSVAIRRAN